VAPAATRRAEVFYEPAELVDLLARQGWRAFIEATRWFVYGSARPDGSEA
jgi:hypothetical protein